MQTSVLVGCDSIAMAIGVKGILEQDNAMSVIAVTGSISQAMHLLPELTPDVVLISVVNFDEEHYKLLSRTCYGPSPRLVMLVNPKDWATINPLIKANITACVSTIDTENEILRAVRYAAKGYSFISPSLRTQEQSDMDANLSRRELEVLALISSGYTSSEISDQLSISIRTVESHRRSIGQKLGTKSRAQMVRYAASHGIRETPPLLLNNPI